ncbi:hypothetical protein EG329_003917 [Mollisiaceae sp. DMI_Dod_QoI]|nr:hypothetical protein EG329_003917 [Helotiales sp. DMI_Dod_QoI]
MADNDSPHLPAPSIGMEGVANSSPEETSETNEGSAIVTTTETATSKRKLRCFCPDVDDDEEDITECIVCGFGWEEKDEINVPPSSPISGASDGTLVAQDRELELKPIPNTKGNNTHWAPDTTSTKDQKACTAASEDAGIAESISDAMNTELEKVKKINDKKREEEKEAAENAKLELALQHLPNLADVAEIKLKYVARRLTGKQANILLEVGCRARSAKASARLLSAIRNGKKKDGNSSNNDIEMADLSFNNISVEQQLQQAAHKELLQCLDTHTDAVLLCTHCRTLHPTSPFHPRYKDNRLCPASLRLGHLSTVVWTSPSIPRNNLFIKELNFSDVQKAMKVWQKDSWRWGNVKSKMGLSQFEKFLSHDVEHTSYGSCQVVTEFYVANERGKERLMYRTQHIWFVSERKREPGREDPDPMKQSRRAAETDMRMLVLGHYGPKLVSGLCHHISSDEFWEFDDPGKHAGVKRCEKCALEWEVSHGDVFAEDVNPEGVINAIEFTAEDSRVNKMELKEKRGEIIVLTCWRDFGACKSVWDPRWTAHFREFQYTAVTDLIPREMNGWTDEENEEPAQDWEFGGIKRAFEGIDTYADNEGGDLKWHLEEKDGKKVKVLMGGMSWINDVEKIVTVEFRDLTKILPKPPKPPPPKIPRMMGSIFGGMVRKERKTNSLLVGLTASSITWASQQVTTNYGTVQGATSDLNSAVTSYKGIPFATPPIGDLRWRAPTAPSNWTEVLNATSFGADCAQSYSALGLFSSGSEDISEDCLYMNIWTPTNATSTSNLPVYVWIYGGRFEGGAGSVPTYDGSNMAAKGIVVVNFNYRMGPFGFLAHPELDEESGHNASGNYGLLDQIQALTFVQENIAAFGGNGSHITVGGQSAGSASALAMMYSPLSSGKLVGCIAESAAALTSGKAFLSQMNVTTIAELRNISMANLLKYDNAMDDVLADTVFTNSSEVSEPPLWRPVIDGYVLPYLYGEALSLNQHGDIPILTGDNSGETGNATMTLAKFKEAFETIMLGNLSTTFFNAYPATDDATAGNQSFAFWDDVNRVSTYDWARAWRAGGATEDVFLYYWTHAPPNQTAGAYHGSELWYVFGNKPTYYNYTWGAIDYALQISMGNYWANFIKTGNPNGGNLAPFPAASNETQVMWLGNSNMPWHLTHVYNTTAQFDVIQQFFSQQIEF